MTPWIADVAWAHSSIDPHKLAAAGCVGIIGYAGCDDTSKCVTAQDLAAWRGAGLLVGLVVENGTNDLTGGAPVGRTQGLAIVAAARDIGYDPDTCVLYTTADFQAAGPEIDEAMDAFASVVPRPGLYSTSYAIDYCAARGHIRHGWQSETIGWSNGTSGNADLLQIFGDPRSAGQQVDVNDIVKIPTGLMGETPGPATDWLTMATLQDVQTAVTNSLNAYFATGEGNPTTGRIVQAVSNTAPGIAQAVANAVPAIAEIHDATVGILRAPEFSLKDGTGTWAAGVQSLAGNATAGLAADHAALAKSAAALASALSADTQTVLAAVKQIPAGTGGDAPTAAQNAAAVITALAAALTGKAAS